MPKCDFSKVTCNFIEIALRHGYSPVDLIYILRTPLGVGGSVSEGSLINSNSWLKPLYTILVVTLVEDVTLS